MNEETPVPFEKFWLVLDRSHIIRRMSLVAAWVLTFKTYYFCFKVGEAANWDATTIGACFAILTPVSGLMGMMVKFYNEGRKL